MAGAERDQLVGIELTIESAVSGLPHGQANRLRSRIWDGIVRDAEGITNIIKSHRHQALPLQTVEPPRRNIFNSPIPEKAAARLAAVRETF